MDHTMKLSIRTPEKELYVGSISELLTESEAGGIGILFDHMPMTTILKPSVTSFTDADGKKKEAFTSSGLLNVKNNEIQILCDAAEWSEDIDIKRAEGAKIRAEKRLEGKDGIDVKRAESALMRSLARIKVKEK